MTWLLKINCEYGLHTMKLYFIDHLFDDYRNIAAKECWDGDPSDHINVVFKVSYP